jgi:small subunit ribosomal protein S19
MGRSIRKGPFIAYKLLEKVNEMNENGKKITIKTWSQK